MDNVSLSTSPSFRSSLSTQEETIEDQRGVGFTEVVPVPYTGEEDKESRKLSVARSGSVAIVVDPVERFWYLPRTRHVQFLFLFCILYQILFLVVAVVRQNRLFTIINIEVVTFLTLCVACLSVPSFQIPVIVGAALHSIVAAYACSYSLSGVVHLFIPPLVLGVPLLFLSIGVKGYEVHDDSGKADLESSRGIIVPVPSEKYRAVFLHIPHMYVSLLIVVCFIVTFHEDGNGKITLDKWSELISWLMVVSPAWYIFKTSPDLVVVFFEGMVRPMFPEETRNETAIQTPRESWRVPPARSAWDSPVRSEAEKWRKTPSTVSLISIKSPDSLVSSVSENESPKSASVMSNPLASSSAQQVQTASPRGVLKSSHMRHRTKKNSSTQLKNVDWRRGAVIGKGGFGAVFIGLNEANGQLMAVKMIAFDPKDRTVQRKLALLSNEIALMKTLEHPNIVSYYFTERVGNIMNIFMEYVAGGSLLHVLNQFGPLGDYVSSAYAEQVLIGLEYLHSMGVVHRDIKCANVLLTVDGVCKLADFGAAIHLTKMLVKDNGAIGGVQGTPVWMAPEVVTEQGHDWRCDIWSLGCTVMEMLTAKSPFSHYGAPPLRTLQLIVNERIQLPERISSSARSLMMQCFNKNPEGRPSAEQLLQHKWFSDDASICTRPSSQGTRSDVVSVTSRGTSQASSLGKSQRYQDAMKGLPLPLPSRESDIQKMRKLAAVKMDIESRASLMKAPKTCSTIVAGKKTPDTVRDAECLENPMVQIMLGEKHYEDSVFNLPPNFHKLVNLSATSRNNLDSSTWADGMPWE